MNFLTFQDSAKDKLIIYKNVFQKFSLYTQYWKKSSVFFDSINAISGDIFCPKEKQKNIQCLTKLLLSAKTLQKNLVNIKLYLCLSINNLEHDENALS
ncbi:hypothetical protein BpHYR1_022158 [Brachionus plicatilis]|uniref:Uncharacterized protein n=1 Tax=Brachionus plicatilis TaxID=10195 RepID=A0A3M7SKM0_BRAPC|nr:hypothetical protein BpHYR1_022158 [Brachionus plicatilis]